MGWSAAPFHPFDRGDVLPIEDLVGEGEKRLRAEAPSPRACILAGDSPSPGMSLPPDKLMSALTGQVVAREIFHTRAFLQEMAMQVCLPP